MPAKRRLTVPMILAMFLVPAPALAAPAVTNTNDAGAGSLRQAIIDASSGDTIDVPAGTYTLSSGQLDVDKSLTIAGAGARSTVIDAASSSRVIKVESAVQVLLSHVTVTGGNADQGAGIFNDGTLVLDSAQVSGNDAVGDPTFGGQGGGIFNNNDLTVTNSAVAHNTADGTAGANDTGGQGGGIFANDVTRLTNTTVSGNEAQPSPGASFPDGQGGGIFANDATTLTNVTVAGNVSSGASDNAAGGIFINDHTTFKNSLVARNTVSGAENDCVVNAVVTDGGHNLEGANDCGLGAGAGDLHNTDPLIGPLGDNGGESDTRALTSGSPAIDAADASACPVTDQRGVARPQGPGCDIGAFELQLAAPQPQPQPLPAPGTQPAQCKDTLKPVTLLHAKGVKYSHGRLLLRGSAHDRGAGCPSGLRNVQVSLARVAGRTSVNCRFLRSRTSFHLTRPQNCRRPVLFTAHGKKSWSFAYDVKLPPGEYRVQARATDRASNKETPKKRRNIVIFTVH